MTDKMPPGVELNGKQLRITFMLHGQRCREPLPGIDECQVNIHCDGPGQ